MLAFLSLVALTAAPPLRIAAVFNLDGGMAEVDGPGYNGMRLAADEINRRGGIRGRRVELVLVNGHSDIARNGTLTEALLRRGKIDAVAGLYDSGYAIPVGRAAQRHRVPFVTSGATLPGLTRLIGDYAFMACYGDDDQSSAMADFARHRLGAHTASVEYDSTNDYPRAIGQGFLRSFRHQGGKVTRIPGMAASRVDSDVLYLGTMPDAAGPEVKAFRSKGFAGPILSGDGFDTPTLAAVAGPDARSVYFTTHVAYDNPAHRVQSFVRAYRARYGQAPPSAAAALAYDTLRLIADAAGRQGRGSLRDAIARTRGFVGITGKIGFSGSSREPQKPITVVQLIGGKATFEEEVLPTE